MEFRKLVAVCLALSLVAAIWFLGLPQSDGPESEEAAITNEMNATEITSAVIAANDTVERFDFRVNTTTRGAGFNSTVQVAGGVDRADSRARIRTTVRYDDQTQTNRVVIDRPIVYHKRANAERWVRINRTDLPDASWLQPDRLSTVVNLLQSSNASVVGSDTINGTPVTVLEAEPELRTYQAVVRGEETPASRESDEDASVSLRVAVANETGRPRKAELRLGAMDSAAGTTTTVTHFSGYNPGTEIRTPRETVSERSVVTTEVASADGTDTEDERATVITQEDDP